MECLLSSGNVLSLALPSLEGGGLKGAAVREREGPWASDGSDLVHFVEVESGLLLRLSTREEHDSAKGRWDSSGEGAHGVPGNLFSGGLNWALSSLSDHVRLEEATLEEHVVLIERLHASGENALSDLSADLNGVVAVSEDLGLNNGSEAVLLTDSSIASQGVGSLDH